MIVQVQQLVIAAVILLLHTITIVDSFQVSTGFSLRTTTSKSENESSTTTTTTTQQQQQQLLPPILQQITNERMEYQINLGRAMDTLRNDMPYILYQTPDFSIYDDTITVIDPSGVQIQGLDKYKSSIQFLQTFIKFWFHQQYTTIQYRMVYDACRSSIRISWHITLLSKFQQLFYTGGGGPTTTTATKNSFRHNHRYRPLHIDGISYYQMNVDTGKIMEHKIETLLVNNTPITPPYGILSILQQDLGISSSPTTIPTPIPQGIGAAYIAMIASTTSSSSSSDCTSVLQR